MRKLTAAALVVLLAMLLATAALLRFGIAVVPGAGEDRGYAYRLDRWTGDVALLVGTRYAPLEPESKDPPR